MNERTFAFALLFLLVAVAALAYVGWWQEGELVTLNERVSAIDVKLREHKPAAPRRRQPSGDAAA